MPPIRLVAAGLSARRGERLLFSGLDFILGPGQLLLITGPNGAGKTTLLRLVAGALSPETGTLVWQGIDDDARPQALMHILSHRAAIKPRLTLSEDLAFWQAVNGPGPDAFEALDRVGLGGLDWLEAGLLSAGQQRRLALARLIVSPRPVWLLDEPTAALDRAGDAMVGAMLGDHLAQGGLAICATHLPLALPDGTPVVPLALGATA